MIVLTGEAQWCVTKYSLGVYVRTRLEQHFHHLDVALLNGIVQCGVAMVFFFVAMFRSTSHTRGLCESIVTRGWVSHCPVYAYTFFLADSLANLCNCSRKLRFRWYINRAFFFLSLFFFTFSIFLIAIAAISAMNSNPMDGVCF